MLPNPSPACGLCVVLKMPVEFVQTDNSPIDYEDSLKTVLVQRPEPGATQLWRDISQILRRLKEQRGRARRLTQVSAAAANQFTRSIVASLIGNVPAVKYAGAMLLPMPGRFRRRIEGR